MTKCEYCKDKGAVGHPESPDSCPYCGPMGGVTEARVLSFGFTLGAGENYIVELVEWSDGVFTANAMSKCDWLGWDEWREIVFDHAPTVAEIVEQLDDQARDRWEAWEESRIRYAYSGD